MRRTILIAIILFVLSGALHAIALEYPVQPVFDEVYFATFASSYAAREPFLDIHPPLGKLILGGMARAFGVERGYSFFRFATETDGAPKPVYQYSSFEDLPYGALRATVGFAGALAAPLSFLMLLSAGASLRPALLGGMLVLFENAFLLHSRLILLDAFLVVFGLLAVLLFFTAHRAKTPLHGKLLLGASAVSAGLAGSVKLTGFGFLLFLAGILVLGLPRFYPSSRTWLRRRFSVRSAAKWFAAVALSSYFLIFAVHSIVVPAYARVGAMQGFARDAPDKEFFARVSSMARSHNGFAKFASASLMVIADHAHMLAANSGESVRELAHPASTPWVSWPFMWKPFAYWNGVEPAENAKEFFSTAHMALVGNPVVWWGSGVGILAAFLLVARAAALRVRRLGARCAMQGGAGAFFEGIPPGLLFFLLGFAANFLPFALISRSMFLYHYFPALIFAVAVLVILLDRYASERVQLACAVAAVTSFLILAPFTYGFPFMRVN